MGSPDYNRGGSGGVGAFIAVRIFGVVAKERGLEKRHQRPTELPTI